MLMIRLVMPRAKLASPFFETNAVKTVKVCEALDYLLDPQMFRTFAPEPHNTRSGVTVVGGRAGYDLSSRIEDVRVEYMRNIGAVKDKYMTDFLFIVDFYQQKERGDRYAVQDFTA